MKNKYNPRIVINGKIRVLYTTYVAAKIEREDYEEAKVIAKDELLFQLAQKGRVPSDKVKPEIRENIKELIVYVIASTGNYYVGRAKAMKAYKTNNYKPYYLNHFFIPYKTNKHITLKK